MRLYWQRKKKTHLHRQPASAQGWHLASTRCCEGYFIKG